jgi:hypothetical protein
MAEMQASEKALKAQLAETTARLDGAREAILDLREVRWVHMSNNLWQERTKTPRPSDGGPRKLPPGQAVGTFTVTAENGAEVLVDGRPSYSGARVTNSAAQASAEHEAASQEWDAMKRQYGMS